MPTVKQLAVENHPGQLVSVPDGSGGTLIGLTEHSKIGFFGAPPVGRVVLPANATLNDVITALKYYNLMAQEASPPSTDAPKKVELSIDNPPLKQ